MGGDKVFSAPAIGADLHPYRGAGVDSTSCMCGNRISSLKSQMMMVKSAAASASTGADSGGDTATSGASANGMKVGTGTDPSDLIVYVTWSGTDKNGRNAQSSAFRFS